MDSDTTNFIDLIPGLPVDLGLDCLTRLPHSEHRVALRVCTQWHSLLQSDHFHAHRKKTGHTKTLTCFVQAHVQPPSHHFKRSLSVTPCYGITLFDPQSMSWERLDPLPQYPFGLPLFCQVASCHAMLVLMGGWDPVTYEPLTAVFVYDFRTSQWRRGRDMPEKTSFFATGSGPDRVYVAGGHDQNKNALSTAWGYDPRSDEWVGLPRMSRERDECEGMVVGDEFWVVSGYSTERQGMFDASVEVLDFRSGRWSVLDGVWESGRCPRSCAGVGEDGKIVNWRGANPGLRFGVCGVRVGSKMVLAGSEFEGAPHGFYLMEMGEGQSCKLGRISVPESFSGFVQSGCCVEI